MKSAASPRKHRIAFPPLRDIRQKGGQAPSTPAANKTQPAAKSTG
jgi:hypothetical protein